MAGIQVRPYQPRDWPRINEIHDAARRNELRCAGLDAAFLTLQQTYENEGLFDGEVMVAETANGDVVGFVAFHDDEITWLYVDPSHARRGIGRTLLLAAVERCGQEVGTEALVGNLPAIALYESVGFQTVSIEKGRLAGNESFEASGNYMKLFKQGSAAPSGGRGLTRSDPRRPMS